MSKNDSDNVAQTGRQWRAGIRHAGWKMDITDIELGKKNCSDLLFQTERWVKKSVEKRSRTKLSGIELVMANIVVWCGRYGHLV